MRAKTKGWEGGGALYTHMRKMDGERFLRTALLSMTLAASVLAEEALGGARVSAAGVVVPVGREACDLLEPPTAAGDWASAALGPLSCKPEEVEPFSASNS